MANEVTTTSLNDVTNATITEAVLLATLAERGQLLRLAREFSLVGRAANALVIPRVDSFWGTPGDRGAGVDTEFNATEAVEISNTPVTTSPITITAAEYGIAVEITDNVEEDSIGGLELRSVIENNMVNTLYLAMADDLIALFAGLSNSVGTSGADLTIAQFMSGATGIRTRGGYAPDGLVAVLDNEQVANLEGEFTSSNAAAAVFALAADRFIGAQPAADRGLTGGAVMSLRGIPVYPTGLTDTANAGADVVGAIFVPSSAANDPYATFGMVWKRLPRFETERHAKKRTTDLVMTTRAGFAELTDGTGTKVVTDAP